MKISKIILLLITIGIANSFFSQYKGYKKFNLRDNVNRVYVKYGVNNSLYGQGNATILTDSSNFKLLTVGGESGYGGIRFNNFNAELGYYITQNFAISFSYDVLSYVNINNYKSTISGNIDTGFYRGEYKSSSDKIRISDDFMSLNHSKLSMFGINASWNGDFIMNKNSLITWSYYFGGGVNFLNSKSSVSLFQSEKVENSGQVGFGLNALFGSRLFLGPLFFDIGAKTGYLDIKNIKMDLNNGILNHNMYFFDYQFSVGLSFILIKK